MKTGLIKCVILSLFVLISCGKKTEETTPIRKDVTETVFASGVLEANNTYSLTAQTDGYLSKINFEEGDLIITGEVLAEVDNKENNFNTESAEGLYQIAQSNTSSNAPSLMQAKNNITITKSKLDQDQVQWQRYQKLWKENSVALIDFENATLQLKTSKANYESALENYKLIQQQADQQVITNKAQKEVSELMLTHNQIKALANGKVYKKYKEIGDYVKRGDVIALIGEAKTIYAKVNIDEANIDKVKLGQAALIKLNTNKSKIYNGVVVEIYPSFDEATQSFICKINFTEELDFKIINTQLQANIIIAKTKAALLIPRNYIDFGGFVQIKGQNQKVKVVTKFVSNEWVQILKGIDQNTVLITDNIAENKMNTSEVGSQMK
ncbi:efflux RND transporter periplasmic adaptor subunit [Flavobacterium sp. RSSB_23]|uniref:efflux RND transporter periplasmic adaptor subunit n=1 Tax=Flavobacterium sp. RSSB_23 TaxID=3447668 RepID=UPI003F3CFC23